MVLSRATALMREPMKRSSTEIQRCGEYNDVPSAEPSVSRRVEDVVPSGIGGRVGGCARISSTLRRYAPIFGLLRLRSSGIPDLRVYLWVAGHGLARASADVRTSLRYCRGCAPIFGLLPLRPSGFLDMCVQSRLSLENHRLGVWILNRLSRLLWWRLSPSR